MLSPSNHVALTTGDLLFVLLLGFVLPVASLIALATVTTHRLRLAGHEIDSPTPAVGQAPVGEHWLADPLHREDERLWNGTRWTEHVRSRQGHYWSAPDSRLRALAAPDRGS